MAYVIRYTREAKCHLKKIPRGAHAQIRRDNIKYLSDQPDVESAIRKRLRSNDLAEWELRIQRVWRVFYTIYVAEVEIVAIGKKDREKLYIDGEEVKL